MSNQVYANKDNIYSVVNPVQKNYYEEVNLFVIPQNILGNAIDFTPNIESGDYLIMFHANVIGDIVPADFQVNFLINGVSVQTSSFNISSVTFNQDISLIIKRSLPSGENTRFTIETLSTQALNRMQIGSVFIIKLN